MTFVKKISSTVKTVTGNDVTMIAGFSKAQLQALAQQSALVADMIEANAFTAAEKMFHLDGLDQMARGFVTTFVQIVEVEIEKIYNAVVKSIYGSIGTLAGVKMPVPGRADERSYPVFRARVHDPSWRRHAEQTADCPCIAGRQRNGARLLVSPIPDAGAR